MPKELGSKKIDFYLFEEIEKDTEDLIFSRN